MISTSKKSQILVLRCQGLSYRQIEKRVSASKDTISRLCRNIILSPQKLEILKNNQTEGQRKASLLGARKNMQNRIEAEKRSIKQGIKEIGNLTIRDKFLFGVALYMGEGSKTGSGVEFTNSDPDAVKFMVDWFQKFCQISSERLRCSLWLHQNLSESDALKFWSELINIPVNQFGKTYFATVKNSQKGRKNYHPYGIIKVRFYDTAKLRLIKGWITGVLSNSS